MTGPDTLEEFLKIVREVTKGPAEIFYEYIKLAAIDISNINRNAALKNKVLMTVDQWNKNMRHTRS